MTAAEYLDRKVAGLCVYSTACQRPLADDGALFCHEHNQRAIAGRKARRASPEYRRRLNRSTAMWRRRRRKQGLCTRCPRLADVDSFFCPTCDQYFRSLHPSKGVRHASSAPPARRPARYRVSAPSAVAR